MDGPFGMFPSNGRMALQVMQRAAVAMLSLLRQLVLTCIPSSCLCSLPGEGTYSVTDSECGCWNVVAVAACGSQQMCFLGLLRAPPAPGRCRSPGVADPRAPVLESGECRAHLSVAAAWSQAARSSAVGAE